MRRCLFAIIGGALFDAGSAQLSLTVSTDRGPVEGIRRFVFPEFSHVDKFLGIPFAEPPVGALRFRAPQPVKSSWGPEPRPAKTTPAPCPQFHLAGKILLGKEDCLYANVFTPSRRKADASLPVMFWIYGGAYILGDGAEFGVYDGGHLVTRHDMVFVSHNYRLSALGFFALEELQAEDPDRSVGNQALQDQQAALRWVQRNIAQFGGDPGRVTIAGESAGGFSVQWHLVSPRSKGLFHGAISMSGTSRTDWFFQPLDEAAEFYGNFSKYSLGCPPGPDRLECLRKVPFEEFVLSVPQVLEDGIANILHIRPPKDPAFVPGLWPFSAFSPVIDGSEAGLLGDPIKLMRNGTFNKVPLIVGGNQNDGDILEPLVPFLGGLKIGLDGLHPSLENFLKVNLKNETARAAVLAAYSLDEFHNEDRRSARFLRDFVFECSSRNVARAFNDHGVPAWLYSFSFDFGENVTKTLGDCHATELPFLFRNYIGILNVLLRGQHFGNVMHMSDAISCAWASHVTCQSPRCTSSVKSCAGTERRAPEWPRYESKNQSYYSLRELPLVNKIKEAMFPADEFPPDRRCDLLETLDLSWRDVRHPAPSQDAFRVLV